MSYGMESPEAFAYRIGLGEDGAAYVRNLPEHVQEKVIHSFNPAGTKDGNVLGRLQAFASGMMQKSRGEAGRVVGTGAVAVRNSPREFATRLRFDPQATELLSRLPEDIQQPVMATFDPSGTKDGHVFGRLLGFVRPIWMIKLGLEGPAKQEALTLMRSLPDDVQSRVICQFDPSGTNDGNLVGRLHGFATSVAKRMGAQPTAGFGIRTGVSGGLGGRAPAASPGGLGGRAPAAVGGCGWGYESSGFTRPQASHQTLGGELLSFSQSMNLDTPNFHFMRCLPEDVQQIVISSFDPSGTKDGNVWGRLFGFIRSVWSQRCGLDFACLQFLKSFPVEVQQVVISKFDPSRTKDGNIMARLESFARSVAATTPLAGGGAGARPVAVARAASNGSMAVQEFIRQWNLPPDKAAFMEALPESVLAVVVESFRATGTKDGNVWGRLFGFVRSVWSQRVSLDEETFASFRTLSQEAQMEVLATFGEDDAAGAHARIEELVLEASGSWRGGGFAQQARVSAEDSVDLESFIDRCGLQGSAGEVMHFLLGLDPEVRRIVATDFDAASSKDGNVFMRLQGFAAAVDRKRRSKGKGKGKDKGPGKGKSFGKAASLGSQGGSMRARPY